MSRTGTRYLLNNYRVLLNIPRWEYLFAHCYENDIRHHFRSGDFRLHISTLGLVMLARSIGQNEIRCTWTKRNCYVDSHGPGYNKITHLPTLKFYEDMCEYV